ncbi:cytochrome P450 [Apiospora arundinis]|uniref:Cytochrome P450 n=1 Tax=Apiospora arundinis TaxID=335852 RepID=A0ABR2IVB5_9PEZI
MNSTSLWLVSNIIRDIVASGSSDPLKDAQCRCTVSEMKRRAISRLAAAMLPNRDKGSCRCPRGIQGYSGSLHQLGINGCDADEEVLEELPAALQHWAHLTADILTTTLTHILSNPVAYSKLKAEVCERAADLGAQHRPTAAVICGSLSSSLWELPYLQAVMKEGCRMSHAAAAATEPPHVSLKSPKTGDVILGFKIPGGTEVGPDVSGIMRATKYWGNDAEVFRPERWLEARDRESYPTMESALDILWGLKSSTRPQGHDHLGKIAAETFLSMAVTMMLARFDISLVEPPRNASRTGQAGRTQSCYVRFTPAYWNNATGLDVT